MELDALARTLKKVPLFSNLSVSALKLIAFASDRLVFKDREVIFKQGDRADSAFFVESGRAEIIVNENGQQISLNKLEQYDLFGEMALFLRSGRSATIVAIGTMVALKIDGDTFLKMVTENPESALGVMTSLSEKVINSSEHIEKLT